MGNLFNIFFKLKEFYGKYFKYILIFKLHNLLEIIKQEQDIYNIVFHEIIRQVAINTKYLNPQSD
jgi:hypothetical protein